MPLYINCSNGHINAFPTITNVKTEISLHESVPANHNCTLKTGTTENFYASNPVTVFVTRAPVVLLLDLEEDLAGRDEIYFLLDSVAENSPFVLKMKCPTLQSLNSDFILQESVYPSPTNKLVFTLPLGAYSNCSVRAGCRSKSILAEEENFNLPAPQPVTVHPPLSFTTKQNSVVDAREFEVNWRATSGLQPVVTVLSNCTSVTELTTNAFSWIVLPSFVGPCQFSLSTLEDYYGTSEALLTVTVFRQLRFITPTPSQLFNSLSLLEILVSSELSQLDDAITVFLQCPNGNDFVVDTLVNEPVSIEIPDDVKINGECFIRATTQVPFYLETPVQSLFVHAEAFSVQLTGPSVVFKAADFQMMAVTDPFKS